MLHKRTTAEDEGFRPGVEQQHDAAMDISDEFERQFFGDLMLFSVVEWFKHYDLTQLADSERLQQVVDKVEADMLALYRAKHQAVNSRRCELETWVKTQQGWAGTPALYQITQFLRNIELNFGDEAKVWQQIQSESHRQGRKQQIVDALLHYRGERLVWDQLFR
jgi:hypothetical protein